MIKRTLYFGNPVYLSLSNSQMVACFPQEKDKPESKITFPIEDIGYVVLDHRQITITQALIDELQRNSSILIGCDKSHMPSSMTLALEGNTLQSERYKHQIESSVPLRKQLWRQTIMAKIANQRALLDAYTHAETGCMSRWETEVLSNDSKNHEARAAVYYWKNIFADIPDFVRDRYGEYPNSLLNYGYAILRAVIARALICKGLLLTLGIHHHNKYNAFCLADDIMEPYRPFVDALVLKIKEEFPDDGFLNVDIKKRLLSIPVIDTTINGHKSPLMIAADATATSLYKCFTGETKKIAYPKFKPA